GTLTRGALATSAHYFSARKWRRTSVTPLVDPARRRASTSTASVTVAAPSCMLADALTKVAMLRGPGMVRRLGGHALIIPALVIPESQANASVTMP
ncbi:MAG: FAD:protein FMN transferase, partial [Betaproteobacteria bacterium]